MKTRKSLLSWKKREENLKEIKRYHKFKVMLYRTDDLIHFKRVGAILEEILPYIIKLYPKFDITLARLIAQYHDDIEIVLEGGDIPLQYKLMMNHEELSDLQRKELLAAEMLSKSYPKKIKGYEYKQLLIHAVLKNCIEAQAVSFADKVDGYCEAIHEILAGNTIFLEPIINYLSNTFNNLNGKYPLIKKLFKIKNVWFNFLSVVDLKTFFEDGNIGSMPHNLETIKKKTLIPQYEKWKEVTLKNFGIELLINQVEFHHITK